MPRPRRIRCQVGSNGQVKAKQNASAHLILLTTSSKIVSYFSWHNPQLHLVGIAFIAVLFIQIDVHGQSAADQFQYLRPQSFLKSSTAPTAFPNGIQVYAHEGDSLALVTLYNSTGGPSTWLNRSGWLQEPVSDWHGISLDGSGRVIVIEQYANGLTGTLPSELGQLTMLQDLNLFGNSITGVIPPELGQLTALEICALAENSLTGTIPPELGQLTNLQALGLNENTLSGSIPPELGQLRKLEWLQLYANQLSGPIPPELGQLAQLKYLVLDWNELSGPIPQELGRLYQLKHLYLNHNQLSSLSPGLGRLDQLERLGLLNNDLTGPIPPDLGQLTKLEWLILSQNGLSGTIPPELGQLSQLKTAVPWITIVYPAQFRRNWHGSVYWRRYT